MLARKERCWSPEVVTVGEARAQAPDGEGAMLAMAYLTLLSNVNSRIVDFKHSPSTTQC
jgi:hypothetical protein